MTKKERTIKAFEVLIEKFMNPKGKVFFSTTECVLCDIHMDQTRVWTYCMGCPLARKDGEAGCMDFDLFRIGERAYAKKHDIRISYSPFSKKKPFRSFILIADLIEKYLPVIKKWPASRFTKSGWKYSEEISRGD